MAATLAQIVGVEPGVRASTEQWWKTVRHALQTENMLTGIDQSYQPEEGHLPQPPKQQRVQVNVEQQMAEARAKFARYFDVTATKDWANAGPGGARADVKVDGHVILEDVPATFLLFLDKRMSELGADIAKIPVQSLAEDWHRSTEPGIWRTGQDKRKSTAKIQDWAVIVPATPEHPAQIQPVSKDVISGEWTTVKSTSAPTTQWRDGILERIAALREGIQAAIYDANRAEAPDVHVSGPVLDYVFGERAVE